MSVPEETLRRYVEGFVPVRLLSGESGAITALDALAAELRAVRADNQRLRALLQESVTTIEGLAEQQAMADDWFLASLGRIRTAAAPGEDE